MRRSRRMSLYPRGWGTALIYQTKLYIRLDQPLSPSLYVYIHTRMSLVQLSYSSIAR
jgi:hypothetical protein